MAKISEYSVNGTPQIGDKLIGTDVNDSNITKNFTLGDILSLPFPNVPEYADNAEALLNGLVVGNIYRITASDILGIVH